MILVLKGLGFGKVGWYGLWCGHVKGFRFTFIGFVWVMEFGLVVWLGGPKIKRKGPNKIK